MAVWRWGNVFDGSDQDVTLVPFLVHVVAAVAVVAVVAVFILFYLFIYLFSCTTMKSI